VKGCKTPFQANGAQKQAAVFICDKAEFKLKLVRRDKKCGFILIKGTIHPEDITIINILALSICALNFLDQKLLNLKAQIDLNKVIVGDFNNTLAQYNSHTQNKSIKKLQD
jgi:hypothetical protein